MTLLIITTNSYAFPSTPQKKIQNQEQTIKILKVKFNRNEEDLK